MDNTEESLKQIASDWQLDYRLVNKHGDLEIGARTGYTFYIRSNPVEDWIERLFEIPKPIESKITRNLQGKLGWVKTKLTFLGRRGRPPAPVQYEQLVKFFGFDYKKQIKEQLPLVITYRDALLEQLKKQAQQWVKLNEQIASVLKVYFIESLEVEKDPSDLIKSIFVELLQNPSINAIQNSTLIDALDNDFVNTHVCETTKNGILAFSIEKDEILDNCILLVEKYHVADYFVQSALLGVEIDSPEQYKNRNRKEGLLSAAEKYSSYKSSKKGSKYPSKIIEEVCEISIDYLIEHELEYLGGHIAKCGRIALEKLNKRGLSPTKNTVEDWIREFAKKEKMLIANTE